MTKIKVISSDSKEQFQYFVSETVNEGWEVINLQPLSCTEKKVSFCNEFHSRSELI